MTLDDLLAAFQRLEDQRKASRIAHDTVDRVIRDYFDARLHNDPEWLREVDDDCIPCGAPGFSGSDAYVSDFDLGKGENEPTLDLVITIRDDDGYTRSEETIYRTCILGDLLKSVEELRPTWEQEAAERRSARKAEREKENASMRFKNAVESAF